MKLFWEEQQKYLSCSNELANKTQNFLPYEKFVSIVFDEMKIQEVDLHLVWTNTLESLLVLLI